MANKHQARVYIKNMTDKPIFSINVFHRFGDGPSENLSWESCDNGQETAEARVVNYETGFGAMTSFDWWIVTWAQDSNDGHGQNAYRVFSSSASLINGFSEMVRQSGSSIGNAINQNLSNLTEDSNKIVKVGISFLTDCVSLFWTSFIGSKTDKSEYKELRND